MNLGINKKRFNWVLHGNFNLKILSFSKDQKKKQKIDWLYYKNKTVSMSAKN